MSDHDGSSRVWYYNIVLSIVCMSMLCSHVFSEEREKGAQGIITTTQLIMMYVTSYRNTTRWGKRSQSACWFFLYLSLFFLSPHNHVFAQDGKKWQAGLVKHNNASLFRTGTSYSPCCSACPTKKLCGTMGWRFLFSRSSITIIIITHFFSWPAMFGIGV